MTKQELENFEPHYFISTGEDNIMFTLKYNRIDYTSLDGVPVPYVRSFYCGNLSTDYEKAVAKAKEKAGDYPLILEGAKETNQWGSGGNKKTTPQDNTAWLQEERQRQKELDQIERLKKEAWEKAQPVPVTYSRIKFTGVVLGNKTVETQWGRETKSLFQDDRGFKIYGGYLADKGDKISFEASVTVSKDDEKFGFFKRATKVLEQGQDERDAKNYMFDFFDYKAKYRGDHLKAVYRNLTIDREANCDDWFNQGLVGGFNGYIFLLDLDDKSLDNIAKKIEDKLGLDYLNS